MLQQVFKSRLALLVFAVDCALAGLSWFGSFLSVHLQIIPEMRGVALGMLPYVVLVQGLVFGAFGLYKGVWRHASVPDLRRILKAVLVAVTATYSLTFLFGDITAIGPGVWVREFILLAFSMSGVRFAARLLREDALGRIVVPDTKPVLILGAGSACVILLQQLRRIPGWKVVGLLDDDPGLSGRLIYNYRVLGGINSIGEWVKKYDVSSVILAIPSATHSQRRRILELTGAAGVQLLTVPSLEDIMSERIQISTVRNVEIEDLLGREPVVLDSTGLQRLLTDRVVMITGAAGSIGSEICRQVAKFRPKMLVAYELSEPALYHLEQEFREHNAKNPHAAVTVVPIIGDVKNRARLEYVMNHYLPDIVFHAAAYKHVPLMEENNTWEAVQNNIRGTYVAAQAAIATGVEKFVMLSTDKAVNPTSVMGASKRVAEMVAQCLNGQSDTKFVTVRFGNVLGSQGSVVPKFREQIAKGGPITVTSPEITRFFMSIPEAAQLVLQGALMGEGGEIFVLDMGTPIRIANLARDMIRLSGLTEAEIGIVYTGLRPGEKMYEELLGAGEEAIETPHPKLHIAKANPVEKQWLSECVDVIMGDKIYGDDEVKTILREWTSLGQRGGGVAQASADFTTVVTVPLTPPGPRLQN